MLNICLEGREIACNLMFAITLKTVYLQILLCDFVKITFISTGLSAFCLFPWTSKHGVFPSGGEL
jgi:hypothetical protein